MKAHSLTFSGALIERGFWLYVWHVQCGRKAIVYVGRTGDSSSCNAASPFNRLGQHLDVRKSASANMLLRHMRAKGMDPTVATYRLACVGPIYNEVVEWREHQVLRNRVAALEAALGRHMKDGHDRLGSPGRGYDVVGLTHSKHPLDTSLWGRVLAKLGPQLDALPPATQTW